MPSAPPPPQLSASQGMAAPRERLKRPCGMDGWVKSPIVYGPITMFCWWNLPIWMVKSLFLGGFMSSLLLVKSGWLFSTPWFWGLIPNYMLAKSFTSSFVGSIPSRQNKWRHQCQFVGWKKKRWNRGWSKYTWAISYTHMGLSENRHSQNPRIYHHLPTEIAILVVYLIFSCSSNRGL